MAFAGPAANFTLMLIAVALWRIGFATGWLHANSYDRPSFAVVSLFVTFSLNLLLGTFNLLPFPPLDGSSGIMLFMSEGTAHRYLDWLRNSSYARLGLLLGLLLFRYFYGPVEAFARNLPWYVTNLNRRLWGFPWPDLLLLLPLLVPRPGRRRDVPGH